MGSYFYKVHQLTVFFHFLRIMNNKEEKEERKEEKREREEEKQ